MRTTLSIDDDVFEAVQTLAEASGRTRSAVVSELVRRALKPRKPSVDEGGLPRFDVPSGATMIPGNRAQALLADEESEQQPRKHQRRKR